MKLAIVEAARVSGLAFPEVGHALRVSGHVPVQAIVGHIQAPAQEPLDPGRIPLADAAPAAEPVQPFGLARPEALEIAIGLLVDASILDQGARTERRGGFDDAMLLEQSIDGQHLFRDTRHCWLDPRLLPGSAEET